MVHADTGIATYVVRKIGSNYIALKNDGTEVDNQTTLITVLDSIITDKVTTDPAVIEFAEGTFTFTDEWGIDAQSNLIIRGQGIGVTLFELANSVGVDKAIIAADNTFTPTAYGISSTVKEDNTLTLTTGADFTNFTIGDIVKVTDATSISDVADATAGEFAIINATSNPTLTLEAVLIHPFGTLYDTTPQVFILEMEENITIEGITFEDQRTGVASNGQASGIFLNFIKNLTVRNCRFQDSWYAGVATFNCINVTIEDCLFENMQKPSSQIPSYGVQLGTCLNSVVKNCKVERSRHATTAVAIISTDNWNCGWNMNLIYDNCQSQTTTNAHFDVHMGSYNVTMSNLQVYSQPNTTDGGIGIQTRSGQTTINNCTIAGGRTGMRVFTDDDTGVKNIIISNINITGENDMVTGIDINDNCSEILITGCRMEMDRAGAVGIDILGAAVNRPTFVQIVNNFFNGRNGSASVAISGDSNTDIMINSNTFWNWKTSVLIPNTDTASDRIMAHGNVSITIDDATAINITSNSNGTETDNQDN